MTRGRALAALGAPMLAAALACHPGSPPSEPPTEPSATAPRVELSPEVAPRVLEIEVAQVQRVEGTTVIFLDWGIFADGPLPQG